MARGRPRHGPDTSNDDTADIDSDDRSAGGDLPTDVYRAVEVLTQHGWTTVLDDGRVALTEVGLDGFSRLLHANHAGLAEPPHWCASCHHAGEPLTAQERRVARLVATGLTSRQIAARLSVSPRTVDNHVARILTKRKLHSRRQLLVTITATPPS